MTEQHDRDEDADAGDLPNKGLTPDEQATVRVERDLHSSELKEGGEDTTLLSESVESPRQFSSAPLASVTAKILAEDNRQGANLVPGDVVRDRFVIKEILGRGGMGVVYQALDLRKEEAGDRNPYVALKALSDDFQRDEKMIISLQRESRKAQSLAHPNIATVYDFDRQGSLVFLTMEVLAGAPLDEFIQEHDRGLPRKRVLPILRGLCLGLAYAHDNGIVHSDFKPGNVFLGPSDNPKVLDFGIARAAPVLETGAPGEPTSEQTQFDAGELGALTPAYAAKEMFLGAEPHPSDDVYALAITAYQLLTGEHPFSGMAAPQAAAQGLKPAPIRGLKRCEWRAIRRGLSFDRDDRQNHAAEFLKDFEGASKVLVVSAFAVSLALALGVYFTYVQMDERARVAPDVPFALLDAGLQQQINQHLRDAQALQRFGDYAGALLEYRSGYSLHPRNSELLEGMFALIRELRDLALERNEKEITLNLIATLDDLSATDDFLARHEELIDIRAQLESLL